VPPFDQIEGEKWVAVGGRGGKRPKGEPRNATTTSCATVATKQTQPTLDRTPRVGWQSRPQNFQALWKMCHQKWPLKW